MMQDDSHVKITSVRAMNIKEVVLKHIVIASKTTYIYLKLYLYTESYIIVVYWNTLRGKLYLNGKSEMYCYELLA